METYLFETFSVSEIVHFLDFYPSGMEISMEIWNTFMEKNMHKFVFCEYSLDVRRLKKLLQTNIIQNLNKQIF